MTTTIPEYGGCLWPVDPACMDTLWDGLDDAVRDRALALASATLERLTGYRVGGCPVTVRPCPETCCVPSDVYISVFARGPFYPGIDSGGQWVNNCACVNDCGLCRSCCEVTLPGPVGEVYEVKVDGIVLPPTDYVVQNGNILVYVGAGGCPWPTEQDLCLPDSEPGTWSVTYLNAYPVDALGAYAAGVLAMEYAKACTGAKCRLPAGVTSVSRQGVSYEITSGAFPGGVTGIREVDTFIALWNPDGLRESPRVWWPGKDTTRHVTAGGTP